MVAIFHHGRAMRYEDYGLILLRKYIGEQLTLGLGVEG